MNRIFHARIAAGQYLFVALAGAIAVYGLWEKQILIAVLFMDFCMQDTTRNSEKKA